jgi:hypothetical protein
VFSDDLVSARKHLRRNPVLFQHVQLAASTMADVQWGVQLALCQRGQIK